MPSSDPILIRCIQCRWNFETRRYGPQPCPNCHAEVFVQPPEGEALPAPAQTAGTANNAVPEPASEANAPPPASQHDTEPMDTLLKMLEEKIREKQRAEQAIASSWETGQGGRFRLFFKVARQILFSPTLFFTSLSEQRVRPALLFGAIIGTLAVIAAFTYGLWNLDANQEELLEWLRTHTTREDPAGFLASVRLFMQVMLFGSPLIGVVNILLMAGLYHLGILLTGREHRGFRATLCATAYGFVPALVVAIPSRFTMFIGSAWPLVLHAVGIAILHRIPVMRGALSVLMPVLLLALLTLPLVSS